MWAMNKHDWFVTTDQENAHFLITVEQHIYAVSRHKIASKCKWADVYLLSKNGLATRPMQSDSEFSVSQKTLAWEFFNSQRWFVYGKAICLWTNSLFSVGHGQGKVKDRVFWPGRAGMQLAKFLLYAFPPLPCYGLHCSISNRLCKHCCCWPHSDQTGHGSICCLHYWWALHTLYRPDYTPWNYESDPWEQFQHITGMIAKGHSQSSESVCFI